jgi:enoyl-CoA hydratase/carnithine racemase
MSNNIVVEKEGHLFIVTINRPQSLNCLNATDCFALSDAWDRFEADDDLWVAIITGAGEKAFSSGHDLADSPDEELPASGWAGLSERTLTKPVIAAVNGYALGGGFEIALACDIVIASENASFALSEPLIGGVALGGGVQRLTKRMPSAIAMGMLLTGKRVTATEAHHWGVVTEVVEPGQALAVAKKWAADIMTCAPLAIRLTKQLAIATVEEEGFLSGLAAQRKAIAEQLFASEDTQEGIRAFVEKRKPVWQGK